MKKYYLFLFLIVSALCAPSWVSAASLNLKLDEALLKNEGRAVVSVYLDPADTSINAIGGELSIISGQASFSDIEDGASIVSAWIERPEIKNNKIVFAGIIPGGFSGMYTPFSKERQPGLLMKFAVTAEDEGEVSISLNNPQLFSGNGEAEVAKVEPEALLISFDKRTSSAKVNSQSDTIAPTNLSIDIMKLGEGADGWFAVFLADDFESGIDHFEMQESEINQTSEVNWTRVSSPARLQDQSRNSYVFIKAVDRQGNEAIAVAAPKENKWLDYWPWATGLVLCSLVVLIIIALWRRRV